MFKDMIGTLGSYTLWARIAPAVVALLPVLLAYLAWFPDAFLADDKVPAIVGVPVAIALVSMLAQLGRDRGKNCQRELYELWGGAPTTRMLRHRDTALNSVQKRSYHLKLGQLLSGVGVPDSTEEAADPTAADQVYEAAVASLRERARDPNRFGLILAENINFGFRRNLYGLKDLGIIFSLLGVMACAYLTYIGATSAQFPPAPASLLTINIGMVAFWLLVVSPQWVKTAADAYAETLLGSLEILQ